MSKKCLDGFLQHELEQTHFAGHIHGIVLGAGP